MRELREAASELERVNRVLSLENSLALETLHARVQMSRDMVMATAVPSFRLDTHVARRRVTQPDVRADELVIDVLRISGLAATESVRQFTRAFRSP